MYYKKVEIKLITMLKFKKINYKTIKSSIKLIIFLFFLESAQAQDKGIKFEYNIHWQAVLDKAKAENKYIFIDCFTTWCGPCKYMNNEIFPKAEVGEIYNEKYINIKLQFDTTSNDKEETMFQRQDADFINRKYKIESYPTYLFFNPEGQLVHRDGGGCDEKEFISKGMNALDTLKQYYTQLKKYQRGIRDTFFLKNLTLLALSVDEAESTAKFAKDYILKKSKVLDTDDDLKFIYQTARATKDTGFIIIMNNLDKFESVIEKKRLYTTLRTIIMQSEFAANYLNWSNWDKIKWENYSKYILKKYPPIGEEALFEIKLSAFQNKKNWVNYVNTIEKYKATNGLPIEQLNEYAWNIFKNCNDIKILKKALAWSKITFYNQTKIEPGYIDTYANLLYKIGKKKEAIEWEKKAQKIAIAAGAGNDWGQDVIEKIKKGEKTW